MEESNIDRVIAVLSFCLGWIVKVQQPERDYTPVRVACQNSARGI